MSVNDPPWIYLAAFNYATGLMTPRLTSTKLIKTRLGILVLLPLQLFMMLAITVPCIFMELALGQYSNRAILRIWDFSPILRGTGLCSFIFFILYQMYYNILCTYTLIFTVLSFKIEPQWKSCNNSWNTINCYTFQDNITRQNESLTSVEEFYLYRIMNSDGLHSESLGTPHYELVLYSLMTTFFIFLANSSGSKFFEKLLIVLIVVPTVQVLILLFIPLIETGFECFIVIFEDLSHVSLKNLDTWTTLLDNASSASSLGFGAFITFGTQSSFRSPIHFKSIVISFSILLYIFVYNITIQSLLISLSIQNNVSVNKFLNMNRQDIDLPEAVFFLPQVNRLWITMWTLNKYLLGLRCLVVMMFLNIETFFDLIPKARKHHSLSVFLFCSLVFYGGLIFSTKAGYLITKTLDAIVCNYVLPFLTSIQLLGVVYIYGITNFDDDIQFMLGIKLYFFWKILYFFHFFVFGSIFIYRVTEFYRQRQILSHWLSIFQHVCLWFSLIIIVSYALYHILKSVVFRTKFQVFQTAKNWGPRQDTLKKSREMFSKTPKLATESLYRQERFKRIE